MKKRVTAVALAGLVCAGLTIAPASANNIAVTNVVLYDMNESQAYIHIKFDVRWENSWRVSDGPANWDAAWVFAKYRPQGSNEWRHAMLSTNTADHTIPAGASIAVGLTDTNGVGAFLYRAVAATGAVNYAGVKLRWNYGAAGLQKGANVEIRVFAIEMVYIPEGSFYLGSGGTEYGRLYDGGSTVTPFQVTSSNAITCTNAPGYLWGSSQSGYSSMGGNGIISNAFPNGYSSFYIMKAEISQGQYSDFLNMLTSEQDMNRREATLPTTIRYTITGSYTNYSASAPNRACNWLSWMDGAAYADWAGLRPMTELEFEKACRGTVYPVTNEYAWGSTNIRTAVYTLSNDGQANEVVSNWVSGIGNVVYSYTISGPGRCGIFAAGTNNPTRAEAGATYYGVMEMSGNVSERCVTIGNSTGRGFRGSHGDGSLSADGYATTSDWPGYAGGKVTGPTGAGCRGGSWYPSGDYPPVSDRNSAAAEVWPGRYYNYGWRAARSGP